jgi:hypothetical protein
MTFGAVLNLHGRGRLWRIAYPQVGRIAARMSNALLRRKEMLQLRSRDDR